MTKDRLHQKIRNICTYHSEDGTSGYDLSEAQFEELFELIDTIISQLLKEREKEVREKISKQIEKYPAGGMCADNCEGALNLQEHILRSLKSK